MSFSSFALLLLLFNFQSTGIRFVPDFETYEYDQNASHSDLVGTNGLEPSTSRLSGVRSNHLSYAPIAVRKTSLSFAFLVPLGLNFRSSGDEEDRTPDPLRARQVLSQLSYTPVISGLRFILLCFCESASAPSKLNSYQNFS